MLQGILNHPAVKKARAAGGQRFGQAVAHLLASERFMGGVQTLMNTALQARATLESGVRRTLHAVNLPSTEDVAELRRKLDELEAMVASLAERTGHGPERADGEKH